MEPPTKRPRIGPLLRDDDDADDELFFDPTEVNAHRDPAVILEQSRAEASYKLKSRWENVFAKYEKDFEGEDDIINFYTDDLPEVEVDNGHLRSLEDVDDTKSVAESESADVDEEERILQGRDAGKGQLVPTRPSALMPRPTFGGRLSGFSSMAPGPPRLSTMFSTGIQFPSFSSFSPFNSFVQPTDSKWNAPELPPEAFNNHMIAQTVTRRKMVYKALPGLEDDESDEDDILMGNTTSYEEERPKGIDDTMPPTEVNERDEVSDPTFPKEKAPEPLPITKTTPNVREEAVPEQGPKKRARSKTKSQTASLAVEDGPYEEAVPDPGPKKRGRNPKEISQGSSSKVGVEPERRKPGRPKATPRKPILTVADSSPQVVVPETPQINEAPPSANGTATQSEKRKRGPARKGADDSVKVASVAIQNGPMVVQDSEAEVSPASPASAKDADEQHRSSPDTSVAEPPSRRTTIEVVLFRRGRAEPAKEQEVTETLVSLGDSSDGQKELGDAASPIVGKKTSVFSRKRKATEAARPITPPDANATHDGRDQTSPVADSMRTSPTAENRALFDQPAEDDGVREPEDAAPTERPEQVGAPGDQVRQEAVHAEKFTRNIIDKIYHFSDEDEPFVASNRVKRDSERASEGTSTRKPSLRKQAAKRQALFGSSPSIRVTNPPGRNARRNSNVKAAGDTSVTEPAPAAPTAPEVSSASIPSAPDTEIALATGAEDAEVSSSQTEGQPFSVEPDPVLKKPQTEKMPNTPSSKQYTKKPGSIGAAFVTPSSRKKSKSTPTPSATRPFTAKGSVLSLLSDSDEDELSLALDQISPLVRSGTKQHLALPVRHHSSATMPSVTRLSLGTFSRTTPAQKKSRLSGGWKSASSNRTARRVGDDDEADVHRTPGGTLRKCGEDEFRCERDFCFACL